MMFSPVNERDLSLFYRQLYTLLNAGSGLYNALEMLNAAGQKPDELKYTNDEVAIASKFFGVGAIVLGLAFGGWLLTSIGRMATPVRRMAAPIRCASCRSSRRSTP